MHPELRHQGIGGALLGRMLDELRISGAAAARVRVQMDQGETVAFLTRRSFSEYDHKVVLELSLARLETAAVNRVAQEHAERVASVGVSILSLADWSRQDPCCLRKLLPAYNAVGHDVPLPDPYKPITMDELRRFLAGSDLSSEGFFVAIHEGNAVGFTYLLEPRGGDHVIVGMTGVLPKFRRLGIATALKLEEIRYARSRGIPTMVTGASAKNVASIAVNERLGFGRAWEEIRLERRLD